MNKPDTDNFHCGFVAIVGRPNVGKSTLVNAIVGEKVSITTHKPQTTRHRILGIKTCNNYQIVLADTPGFHLGARQAINHYMNRTALNVLHEVDLVLFVVEPKAWNKEEENLLSRLEKANVPVFAAVNKVDKLKDKQKLLPVLAEMQQRFPFAGLIPVSARTGDGVAELESLLASHLPIGDAYYDPDQFTDKSLRFIAAELLREQLYLGLGQELPYAVTVEIEAFEEDESIDRIAAVVWVAKSGHKSIVIGKGGAKLKTISSNARLAMEEAFGKQVFLNVWVKVKDDWNDSERALHSLGYSDLGKF